MILFKLAVKQILAHKKRTIITLLLSAFSTALFIFSNAINDGSHNQIIRSGVEIYPGYMEITNRRFEDNPSYDNLIFDVEGIKNILQKEGEIKGFTVRFEAYALYSTDEQSIGALFGAMEPGHEAEISRLKASLVAGEYLSDNDTNALYVGIELAKRLKLGVGDKLSFISTGADYSFAADNLVVKGIFRTKLFEFDNSTAFVNKAYFDEVMQSRNLATHIILMPSSLERIDAVTNSLQDNLPSDLVVKNYKTTMKDLIMAMEIDEIFGYITLGIFFAVIFFVIAIFAFLSVYGRIREIGILRAIGTTPVQIVKLLLIEALLLGLISVAAGGAVGAYSAHYFEKNPIEWKEIGGVEIEEYYKQYNLAAQITLPTEFHPLKIMKAMLIMLLLNLVTVIYPIMMINRFTPIEAIRHV